jgi:hypothetical protein
VQHAAAIIRTWITPRSRRGFSGFAGPRPLEAALAAYRRHLGLPWLARAEPQASGPGQAGGCYPMITVRKVTRSLAAVMPGWLVVICGVCLVIPLARLAALLFTAGLCLVQPARVRRAASACMGGTSHRACGETHWPAHRSSRRRPSQVKGAVAAAALPPGGHRHKVRCPAASPGAGVCRPRWLAPPREDTGEPVRAAHIQGSGTNDDHHETAGAAHARRITVTPQAAGPARRPRGVSSDHHLAAMVIGPAVAARNGARSPAAMRPRSWS